MGQIELFNHLLLVHFIAITPRVVLVVRVTSVGKKNCLIIYYT